MPISQFQIPSFPLAIPLRGDRINKYYKQVICQDLILKQNYKTIMELPYIKKIVLNTTSKIYVNDKKQIIPALVALELISGQKATLTFAKKSIASFKIRQNQILGCKVTLRNTAMYVFLEKLLTIIFPRIRDFNGISVKTLDTTGNFSLGINNFMIFPELENYFELFENTRGFHINFSISTTRKQDVLLFYSAFQIAIKTTE